MKNIIENSCDKISLFLFFRNYLSDNEIKQIINIISQEIPYEIKKLSFCSDKDIETIKKMTINRVIGKINDEKIEIYSKNINVTISPKFILIEFLKEELESYKKYINNIFSKINNNKENPIIIDILSYNLVSSFYFENIKIMNKYITPYVLGFPINLFNKKNTINITNETFIENNDNPYNIINEICEGKYGDEMIFMFRTNIIGYHEFYGISETRMCTKNIMKEINKINKGIEKIVDSYFKEDFIDKIELTKKDNIESRIIR